MTQYALAADLGGTQLRVALVDREGKVTWRSAILTEGHRGRDDVLERFVAVLERAASGVERTSLVGIGVAQAGATNSDDGTMYNPPYLPDWDGFSAKPMLEERLSLVSSHVNDATAGALAEHAYGAGRGARHMVYMALGTGVGGGIVADGRLYTGVRGFAGELGHITIDRNGPVCPCGNTGCLEMLVSGTAVARIAGERLASGERSVLLDATKGELDVVDAPRVAEAARAGDTLAQSIMRDAGMSLGIGIVSLLNALDPEVIVLGGGMSQSLDLLLPWVFQVIERRAIVPYQGRIPVVKSELGGDGSLLGASALAFDTYDRGGGDASPVSEGTERRGP